MKYESSRTLAPHLRPDSIDCEDAEILVSRRIDGELAPTDLALLKAHLKSCASCRAQAEAWAETSCVLVDSISTLWTEESESPAAHSAPKTLPTPRRGAYWLPLGMLASQGVAIVGLAVYLFFFSPRAEAPQMTVRQNPPAPTPAQKQIAPLSMEAHRPSALEVEVAVVPAPPSEVAVSPAPQATPVAHAIETPRAVAAQPDLSVELAPGVVETVSVAPTDEPRQIETPKPLEFAAPLPPVMPRRVDNVSMDFQFGEQSGRVTLLGDILSGKAVIRITDAQGRVQDVAQPDIDSLLPEPQRTAVRHFLAACAQPALRTRFEELRK